MNSRHHACHTNLNLEALEGLYKALRQVNLENVGSLAHVRKLIQDYFSKFNFGGASYFYSGINELLLRLLQCVTVYSSTKMNFSCSISRPRQHEAYAHRTAGDSSLSINPEFQETSGDPINAYYANLSWLYYEIYGVPKIPSPK